MNKTVTAPEVDEPIQPSGHAAGSIVAASLTAAVDLYWMALLNIQNCLEDIEGADGRRDYLGSLRYRLVEALQDMDGVLWPTDLAVTPSHRAAFALQNGLRMLDLSGPRLCARIGLGEDWDASRLQKELLALGADGLCVLPGDIPSAQGPQGQREVIRAMRTWSAAAVKTGDDLAFLASRFGDL
ncbi:MAG: DUF6031 family protein [Phenylobacterium sp.]|jgi:hypothetical protein